MDTTEARLRLDEYADRERRLRRRFLAPVMLFLGVYAFVFVATGGLGSWYGNLLIGGVVIGWAIYARRLTRVSWSTGRKVRVGAIIAAGFGWILLCNAYFVNWNPHTLPLNELAGAALAAAPFVGLTLAYRR